jgi:hypothetical protein
MAMTKSPSSLGRRTRLSAAADGGDAGDRSTVVDDLFGDVRRDTERGHAGHAGAPQIMQSPGFHR